MPSEEAKRNKAAYDTQYILNHITLKTVGFNSANDEDVKMLDWLNRQKNQTQYIKGLIREDMRRAGE